MPYILFTALLGYNLQTSQTTAEFASEAACRYAGAQIEVALRNDFRVNTSTRFIAICVPKGESPNAKTN